MIYKRYKYGIVYVVFRSILQYIKASKGWAVLEHGVTVLSSLSWIVGILVTQQLFDLITEASIGNATYLQVGIALGTMATVIIGQQALRGVDQYLLGYVSYKNVGKFMSELMLKLSRVSAKHFEDPNFLDNIDKSKRCIEYEALGSFSTNCLRVFTYYGVFFLSVSIYFFGLSPLLPLIIFLSFVPAILGQLVQVKVFIGLENESAPLRRKYTYYKKAISSQLSFKETRMLGAFGFFRNLFGNTLLLLKTKTWKVEKKVAFIRLILGLVSFIGFGVSIIILFNSTMAGEISIGTFLAVFAALSQIFSMAEELVSTQFSQASETIGKIEIYYRLMDMEEVDGEEAVIDLSKGIVAKDVNFTYPGTNEMAVQGVTITISEGETIAIVGENGAGKSTLVRLLVGLYRSDNGTVEIGGLDSSSTHPSSIFRETSGVFQHFQRYKMTLAENVTISNTKKNKNHDNIQRVLQDCEFADDSITLDTMLSTEFGGIDLSGGQWQRIAIARGLYKANSLIVLDEPTAAIDPIKEERVYSQFRRLSKDKCSILVTHRLASAKFANRIVVMDKGKIVDVGCHDELIERKGKYATMWEAQSAWYVNRVN